MGLKKGDFTAVVIGAFQMEAIVVEVLSCNCALIRVMSGDQAGEEIEFDFPPGELEFLLNGKKT